MRFATIRPKPSSSKTVFAANRFCTAMYDNKHKLFLTPDDAPCRSETYVEDCVWSVVCVAALLFERSKCNENPLSAIPTLLWAAGAAALSHRLLSALFRRFLFRRVPLWEIALQHLLFVWMVIYSLHFWAVLVKVIKVLVEYCYENEKDALFEHDIESCKIMQQWMIWICGVAPLVTYIQTRPRPEVPPLMIWITTSPWQRREMGPYGYYLNRPLSTLQSSINVTPRHQALTMRRAFSDSKIIIKEPPKKKKISKSV